MIKNYRYERVSKRDLESIIDGSFLPATSAKIKSSLVFRQVCEAIKEDGEVYTRYFTVDQKPGKWTKVFKYTFPFFFLFVVLIWILLAIRFVLTGRPIGLGKNEGRLVRFLEGWNDLGNFKVI